MHRFETAAAEIYKRQVGVFSRIGKKDECITAYQNERNHKEEIKRKILERGSTPSLFSYLFFIGGFFLGLFSSLLGIEKVLQMNINLEQKAVLDYEKSLNTVPFEPGTKALVEKILLDEKRHIELWKRLIQEL